MGEYATYNGQHIKIGTCESMYYLRADQAHKVRAEPGNVDPVRDRDEIRFRFPFPDEDTIEPGGFDDHDRGVKIPGWDLDETFAEHGGVQFKAEPGYLLYLPCPEGPDFPEGLKIGKNGWRGGVVVQQQRYWEGRLVTVITCSSCGHSWRLQTISDAEPVIVAFRSEADRLDIGYAQREFLHAMADRIAAGYALEEMALS